MKIVRDENPLLFFSHKEREKIVSVIRAAEKQTSGEIRLHLVSWEKGDVVSFAREVFERLGMNRTEARNGVLILLAVKSKRFSVLGDQGIHEKVPPGFWDNIVQTMSDRFKEDRFADGIAEAVEKIGEKLKTYFPYRDRDTNELPDEISYSA